MAAKHTAAPWKMVPTRDGNIAIDHPTGKYADPVARVYSYGTSEGVANARLIAAAPELFEALTNALGLWAHLSTDATQQAWLTQARAAIAKAKGEA